MKTLRYFLLSLLLVSYSAIAQEKTDNVIYIKSEKFAQPLVEKWIEQFSQTNNGVEVKIAEQGQEADITLQVKSTEIFSSNNVIYVGRYALLPVVNTKSSALSQLSKIKLNKKNLKSLFFESELPEDENKKVDKLKDQITIYSGNNANSASVFFASYYGYTSSDLKDKRISGDDIFLLRAIEKDLTGVTVNNLAYIYDINTRKLKTDLSLLPLDLKKEYSQILASADLDKTIELLENESIDLIPVNQIGFTYKNSTSAIHDFIGWVLKDGQEYNKNFGFLTLDKSTHVAQEKDLNKIYLTLNNLK